MLEWNVNDIGIRYFLYSFLQDDKEVDKKIINKIINDTIYIKYYPLDFIVNEIDADGNIIYIDSIRSSNDNTQHNIKQIDGSNTYILKFILKKENKSMREVINEISNQLKISKYNITYAGSKDKRAITTQLITINNISINSLSQIESKLQKNGIQISNIQQSEKLLKLGDLKGNKFIIILRNLYNNDKNEDKQLDIIQVYTILNEYLTCRIDMINKYGFINYYGNQRFFSGKENRYGNHIIGEFIFKNDFQSTLKYILEYYIENKLLPRMGLSLSNLSISTFITNKFYIKASISKLMTGYNIENSIIQNLLNTNCNYKLTFDKIQRNTRLFYIYSFQSYIFNLLSSYRLEKYGNVIVNGDIIYKDNEYVIYNSELIRNSIKEYTIDDVYLPLIGKNTLIPLNLVGEYLISLLKELNIDLSIVNKHIGKGDYRRFISKVNNIEYELIKHKSIEDDLSIKSYTTKEDEENIISLRLDFSLRESSYATILIREILGDDIINNKINRGMIRINNTDSDSDSNSNSNSLK